MEKLFRSFIENPSNFIEIEEYSEQFRILIDYWKSGDYNCDELDIIVLKNLKKTEILKKIKENSLDDLNMSKYIGYIEVELKEKLDMRKTLKPLRDLNFKFSDHFVQ